MFGRSSGESREYRFHHSIVRVKNYEKKKKKKRDLLGASVRHSAC